MNPHRSTDRGRKRRLALRKENLCLQCAETAPKPYHTLCHECLLCRATSEAARRQRIKGVTRG